MPVLSIIVQAAIKDRPSGVLIEAVKFFQTLVANLDARFLSQQAVNKPLVRLIRNCVDDDDVDSAWGNDAGGFEEDDDDDDAGAGPSQRRRMKEPEASQLNEALVGLMAFIASKLYTAQELLHIFFHNRDKDPRRSRRISTSSIGSAASDSTTTAGRPASPAESTTSSTATVRANTARQSPSRRDVTAQSQDAPAPPPAAASYDFPLFIYLLRFVHAEGQTGQLARAGLSVIVKIAFETKPLEVSSNPRTASRRVRFTQDADGGVGESAATVDLADYVLGSDFVDVIGASLGAVYGLLPSKLAVLNIDGRGAAEGGGSGASSGGGMSLGVNDPTTSFEAELARLDRLNIEASTSPAVVERVQLFADIFDFLQHDVLATATRCISTDTSSAKAVLAPELVRRLAESVRLSLLNNILLPSMIESGDRDGSATAVMSYLEVLLWILDDASPLADTVASWLVRQEEQDDLLDEAAAHQDHPRRRRGRKSTALTLLEQGRKDSQHDETLLLHYTVKNLIVDHLAPTTSHGTVAAALGLANAFTGRHGRFAMRGLVDVVKEEGATCFPFTMPPLYARGEGGQDGEPNDEDEAFVYPGADANGDQPAINRTPQLSLKALSTTGPSIPLTHHMREIDLYHSLNSALEDSTNPAGVDNRTSWSTSYENYLRDAQDAMLRDSTWQWQRGTSPTAPFRHRLDPSDVLLRAILARLRRFFEQPPQVNVALTALIATVCVCPYRNVEGWLSCSSSSSAANGNASSSSAPSPPILLLLLRSLVAHVQIYRAQVPDFDAALEERRRGLLYVENLSDALAGATEDGEEQESGIGAGGVGAGAGSAGEKERLWRESTALSWPGLEAVRRGGEEWGSSGRRTRKDGLPDAQVVDARKLDLPPRPSDGSNRPGEASQAMQTAPKEEQSKSGSLSSSTSPAASGLLSNATMNRLFGRSSRATAAAAGQQDAKSTGEQRPAATASDAAATTASTPFASHYAQTAAVSLEPLFVEMPPSPWTGRKNAGTSRPAATGMGNGNATAEKRTRFHIDDDSPTENEGDDSIASSSSSSLLAGGTSAAYYPGIDDDESEEARRSRSRVTLSHLLDNVVVLEEFVKMLTAILQMRRVLGVERVEIGGGGGR